MRTLLTLLMALVMLSLCSATLGAEFEEDFESYAAGSAIHGQGGWAGWDNTAGAGAPVSDAYAYSGNNSIEIVSTADLVHEFDVTSGQWVFRTMVYMPSGTAGETYFIMLNTYTSGGDPKDWSVQTLFNLGTGAFTSAYDTAPTGTIIYDQWVELRLMIDLDNNTVDEYYNGERIFTHSWDDTNNPTIQAIDLYGNSASSVYYDDIVLESLVEYQAAPTNPVPASGAVDVAQDAALSWTPGGLAVTHDVYFGTNYTAVATATRANSMGVLVGQAQSAATYAPDALLQFGQMYYWRIDEVRQDGTIDTGNVWNFTAEPFAYVMENIVATSDAALLQDQGPENTINGSGLDGDEHSVETSDMWLVDFTGDPVTIQYEFNRVYQMYEMQVWNHNFIFEVALGLGAQDASVEYSVDGVEWTLLEDVVLGRAPGLATYTPNTVLDLAGVPAKFVRLVITSSYGASQVGLSEVRFLYTPAQARYPMPADAAADVDVTTNLTWRPGRDAASHEVYLGTDPDSLTLASTTTQTNYSPGALNMDTTYYWQIIEVNNAEAIASWAGPVWNFTTEEYIEIDGFETYNDDFDAGTAIFNTWVDGLEDGTNGGSFVGNDPSPFAEQTIVHSGNQSMPLYYDNDTASAISETDRALTPAQDWTASGIKTLSLWFRGAAGNTGTLYIKINNGSKIPYDGDAAALGIAGWHKWNIVLADTGANLNNVTSLSIGVEGVGSGKVCIDDIRLSAEIPAPLTSDIDIAISAQANWWSQAAADREMAKVADNAQAPVVVFNASDEDGLADWLVEHTGNGVANLLILCGKFPDSIYAGANAEPDGSLAELFLDDGNTIINTGDWIFYVGTVTNNTAGGLQNMMDIPGVTVAGGDDTPVTVTAEGLELTPSLQDFATDRPFHLDTLEGDWYAELILAQDADGLLADPVIVRNSATGGRIGVFHQASGEDNLPRGEVMTEWINNWYLNAAN